MRIRKLQHEWVKEHGVVICQCCGESKRWAGPCCMAKWRITTKDGKLKVVQRRSD